MEVARALGNAEQFLWAAMNQILEAQHLASLRETIDPRVQLTTASDEIAGLHVVAADLLETIRIQRWRTLGRSCTDAIGTQRLCSRCAEAASQEVRHG